MSEEKSNPSSKYSKRYQQTAEHIAKQQRENNPGIEHIILQLNAAELEKRVPALDRRRHYLTTLESALQNQVSKLTNNITKNTQEMEINEQESQRYNKKSVVRASQKTLTRLKQKKELLAKQLKSLKYAEQLTTEQIIKNSDEIQRIEAQLKKIINKIKKIKIQLQQPIEPEKEIFYNEILQDIEKNKRPKIPALSENLMPLEQQTKPDSEPLHLALQLSTNPTFLRLSQELEQLNTTEAPSTTTIIDHPKKLEEDDNDSTNELLKLLPEQPIMALPAKSQQQGISSLLLNNTLSTLEGLLLEMEKDSRPNNTEQPNTSTTESSSKTYRLRELVKEMRNITQPPLGQDKMPVRNQKKGDRGNKTISC